MSRYQRAAMCPRTLGAGRRRVPPQSNSACSLLVVFFLLATRYSGRGEGEANEGRSSASWYKE